MSYNRFQWWKQGVQPEVKPLTGKNHSLLARIRHGDFDFPTSYAIGLVNINKEIQRITDTLTSQYSGRSAESLAQDIRDAVRMKNVRRIKLELEMHEKETERLNKLRYGLREKFGFDLWEELEDGVHDNLRTVEDVYRHYERVHGQANQGRR